MADLEVSLFEGLPTRELGSDIFQQDPSGDAARALDAKDAVQPAQEEHHNTDLGNAKRLVKLFNGDFKYSAELGWLAWDGKRWKKNSEAEVERVAHTLGPLLYKEAANQKSEANRKEMAKHAAYSESSKGIKGMLSLVKARREVEVEAQRLDAKPYLFNVQNGTINLKTDEFKKHDKEDYITKISPVKYVRHEKCKRWDEFQEDITPDEDVRAYKQKVFAYTLMGNPTERKFFVAYGKGANGKTTEHKLIEYIAGDYGRTTDFDTFTAKPTGGATPELAALKGARFVAAGEAEVNARFSSALLKKLTGQDTIQARALYKDPFEYQPQFVIWMATNSLPVVNDNSDGFWDRCTPIEYRVQIDENKKDPDLLAKLKTEASGILNWLIKGGKAYAKGRLKPIPKAINDTTKQYRDDQDTLGAFVGECFEENKDSYVTKKDVRAAYVDYCERVGERPWNNKALIAGLRANGWEEGKRVGIRHWVGYALKPETKTNLDRKETYGF